MTRSSEVSPYFPAFVLSSAFTKHAVYVSGSMAYCDGSHRQRRWIGIGLVYYMYCYCIDLIRDRTMYNMCIPRVRTTSFWPSARRHNHLRASWFFDILRTSSSDEAIVRPLGAFARVATDFRGGVRRESTFGKSQSLVSVSIRRRTLIQLLV